MMQDGIDKLNVGRHSTIETVHTKGGKKILVLTFSWKTENTSTCSPILGMNGNSQSISAVLLPNLLQSCHFLFCSAVKCGLCRISLIVMGSD